MSCTYFLCCINFQNTPTVFAPYESKLSLNLDIFCFPLIEMEWEFCMHH